MKKLLLLVLLVTSTAPYPADGRPVTFKCTTANGEPVADLIVTLERRAMSWGSYSQYQIHNITERYLSAYRIDTSGTETTGGEVWILNRINGDYLRTSIELAVSSPNSSDPGELTARTFRGRCSRPIL